MSTRRLIVTAVWAVVALALAVAVAMVGLRPLAQRQLAAALGTPVSIDSLSIRPWRSLIEATGITLGPPEARLAAAQLAITLDLWALLHGDLTADRVDCSGIVAAVEIDRDYHVSVAGFPTQERAQTLPQPTVQPARRVQIRRLFATDATVSVRHAMQGKAQTVPVHLEEIAAKDVAVGSDGSGLSLDAEALGGAEGLPLTAQISVVPAGGEPIVDARVNVKDVTLPNKLFELPSSVASFKGTLGGSLRFRSDPQRKERALQIEAEFASPQLTGRAETGFSAQALSVHGMQVDLMSSRVDLGTIDIKAPEITLTLSPEGLLLPVDLQSDNRGMSGPAWTVSGGRLQVSEGSVTLQRAQRRYELKIETGRLDGITNARIDTIRLVGRPPDGGSLEISGALRFEPSTVDLNVTAKGLSLARLTAIFPELPLRIARGTASGTVAIDGASQRPTLHGTLQVDDLHTLPPEDGLPQQVLASHRIEASFSIDTNQPRIEVAALTLKYPYIMVERSANGVFPYSALSPRDAAPSAAAPAAPIAVSIKQLKIDGGRAEFLDRTVTPNYWTAFADLAAAAHGVELPGPGVGNVWVTARQDEINPVEATGEAEGQAWHVGADLESVFLPTLNAYVAPLLGYELTTGVLSVDLDGRLSTDAVRTTSRLTLRNVSLSQTGLDVIQRETGVPLPIALALLKDPSGLVTLAIAIRADPRSGSFRLGSMIKQALSKALVGALSTPLKLLGLLFGTEGPPRALAIDPIPFAPGSDTLDALAKARLAQIARILAAHTEVTLVAKPEISTQDLALVGAGGLQALANDRAKVVTGAFLDGDVQPRLPRKRLVMVPWKPAPDGALSERTGMYVEMQLSADYGP